MRQNLDVLRFTRPSQFASYFDASQKALAHLPKILKKQHTWETNRRTRHER
jgi:hypothetical protein